MPETLVPTLLCFDRVFFYVSGKKKHCQGIVFLLREVCIAPGVLVQTTRLASSVKKLPITHGARAFDALAENKCFSPHRFRAVVCTVCTESVTHT
jgi:hypothetical protein